MSTQKLLKDIIKNEDPKNPLTDQEIAKKIGVTREQVVFLRKKLRIKSSQERLRESLLREMKEQFQENPAISARELTRLLNSQGYKISRFLVNEELSKIRGGKKGKRGGSPVKDFFKCVIGSEGSLKSQIQQAKAAIFYPPLGLHTLIIGETGTGKSFLAKKMFEFACEVGRVSKSRFIVFNCADYANNPQLLYSNLFGHKKGAFTGAVSDKSGLIEKADGGVFFLDEVHRLPPEGQEMLFNIIDNGCFRRLGETEETRKVNVMIIAATTEEIESRLLATFRRRIPMVIELPPLSERPLQEKLEFIKLFIQQECNKINSSITLTYEACRALLTYNPASNIGQLESDLKVLCAKAYLQYVTGEKDNVEISLKILPRHMQRSFLEQPIKRKEISDLLNGDLIIEPDSRERHEVQVERDVYGMSQDIYRYIENKSAELKNSGLSREAISEEMSIEIEEKLNLLLKYTRTRIQDDNYLFKIVGRKMVQLIDEVQLLAQQELPELIFKKELKYALGLHFFSALQRLKAGKKIIYPNLNKIKNENEKIFAVARKISELFAHSYDLKLPEDEVGYVAAYLKAVMGQDQEDEQLTGEVEVIVVSHGNVASSMLKVANWFFGGSNARAVDMELDEDPAKILEKLIHIVKSIDRNNEVLLLVDMGSLTSFGQIIEETTGIKTKVVPRVDTAMLMEAIRLSKFKLLNLEAIVNRIERMKPSEIRENRGHTVLIFCTTGEGATQKIKDYLIHRLPGIEERYHFRTSGLISQDVNELVRELEMKHELLCVIGNLRPEYLLNSEKFFPISEIFSDEGLARFREITAYSNSNVKEIKLESLFSKNIFLPGLQASSPEEIIDQMAGRLFQAGAVKKSYLEAVKEREEWGPTYVGSGVVIPHADPQHVYYSQVALAVLAEPVSWAGNRVEVVCMVALKDLGVKCFKKLHRNLMDNVEQIKKASRGETLKKILFKS